MQKRLDIQLNVLFLFLKYIFMKGTKGTETKALIRETAFKLFLTKEYNMVPLKDIEQSLNLSRGCMSYHYPTKQELFMDVIDQYILRKQDIILLNKLSDSLFLIFLKFTKSVDCSFHDMKF